MNVALLHGPNLDRLGMREPEIYGSLTLDEVDRRVVELGESLGLTVEPFQSNFEGEFLEHIAAVSARVGGVVINPAAWTHTSVAVRDAMAASQLPFVEVHLSNISAREEFRRHSYLSDLAVGVVYGFGVESYLLGLRGLHAHLTTN